MGKRKFNNTYLLGFYFIAFLFVGYLLPPEVNWTPDYSIEKDNPFSSKLVYERLSDLFPNRDIDVIDRSLFESIRDTNFTDRNYIFIQNRMSIDSINLDELLKMVARGNDAFIAAEHYDYNFLDTLSIRTQLNWNIDLMDSLAINTKDVDLHFYDDKLEDQSFKIKGQRQFYQFESEDSLKINHKPLGWIDSDTSCVFAAVDFGQGTFYLHTLPILFTNYHLLKESNNTYISQVLSYLPIQNIYWDNYQNKKYEDSQKSILHVVLNEKSLKWMYWITCMGILLFMVFHAKRRQRMIPVIEPPKNESLSFVETISQLYYQNANHTDLARKKVRMFKEHLHKKYHMVDITFSKEDEIELIEKSFHDTETIEKVFDYIRLVLKNDRVSQVQLKKLNRIINEFYERK